MALNVVGIDLIAKDSQTPVISKAAASLRQYKAEYESLNDVIKRDADEARKAASATETLSKSTKNAGQAASGAAGGFSSLFKSFTLGTLAANAIQTATRATTDFIRDSVLASREYNTALMGLSSAAAGFGQNIAQVRAIAQSASSDGLVPLTSNAAALKDLMQEGLNLDQATQLLARFKDEAAFGRASTIEYGQAVENLAQAYKTEQSALGNLSGHSENFSVAMERGAAAIGKTVSQLTAAEREQIKFTEYLRAGNHTMGDAALYAETAAGKQAQLAQKTLETQVAIGNALSPAITFLQRGFIDLVQSLGITEQGMQTVQGNFLTLAMVVQQAVNVVVGGARLMYGSIKSLMTLSLDPLIEQIGATGKSFADTTANWQKGIDEIAAGMVDTTKDATNEMVDLNAAAQAKIQDQIEDATRDFERSMEQRTKQFEESMRDMIIAHRDKSLQLKADLAAEEAEYDKSSKKRKQAYLDDVADMEQRHAEKVADIQEQINDEKNSGYAVDGVLYREANKEKIAKLEASLQEEAAKHQQALEKRKAQYDEDVADNKSRHDQKLAQLRAELDAEIAILNTHRTEVAKIGNAQKEDDLTRLKRQYAEANVIAERDHQERLAKIRSQGSAQGGAYVDGYASGVRNKIPEVEAAWKDFMGGIQRGIQSGGLVMGSGQGKGQSFADWMKAKVGGMFSESYSGSLNWGKLWPFAEGGTISRPTVLVDKASGRPYGEMAEGGRPERIVPLSGVQRGLGESGSKTINIGTVVNQSNMDPDAFFRALAWELR